MRKKVTLITGAGGEVGQALVKNLFDQGTSPLLTLDIRPLPEDLTSYSTHIVGDILDKTLLSRLVSEYEVATIYHLAPCSLRERVYPGYCPSGQCRRHLSLLQMAAEQSEWRGDQCVIFPVRSRPMECLT
jgi:GDP-D-mannose dehydratase